MSDNKEALPVVAYRLKNNWGDYHYLEGVVLPEGEPLCDHAAATAAIQELRAEVERANAVAIELAEALSLYADPGFYHACNFMFDRPTGGFDEDFSLDEEYGRLMPGKLARETLASIAARQPDASEPKA